LFGLGLDGVWPVSPIAFFNGDIKNFSITLYPIRSDGFAMPGTAHYIYLKNGLYLVYYTQDGFTYNPESLHYRILYDLNYNTSRRGLVLLNLYTNAINFTADIKYEEEMIEIISKTTSVILYFDRNANLLSYRLKWSPEIHGFSDEVFDFIYDENNRLVQIYHDNGYDDKYLNTSIYYDGLLRTFDRLPLRNGTNNFVDMDDERNFDTRIIYDGDTLKYVITMDEFHMFNSRNNYIP
jgi:hypothetical protein